ncbi:MAG: hypothetical protein M3018_11890 [Actinomycetota bacterium]|nr:hypothetical protein [Actinomycetota bacterium]
MHAAFGTVLLIVCVVSLVIAVIALLWNGRTWEEYGKRGLTFEQERPGIDEPPTGSPAAAVQRESEIRELLQARNARRARRGETQLDVEREVSKLTGAAAKGAGSQLDPALRAEIRELVIARNERMVRAGKPPLDVEREVEREIATLADCGLVEPHDGRGFQIG